MSRRESCVWHPMPEEVRRSSVQSRRASLAAGRRKSMNTNEPDWEVEAPATPPHQDYTPRDTVAAPVAQPAAIATAPAAAAAATPTKEHSPAERDVDVNAAAAEEEERDAVASVMSAEPTEASEEEEVALKAMAQADAEASGRGRTRHIVRFHGEKWAKVLRKQRAEIEAAFLEDIQEAAGVEAEEAKRLKIKMHDCMEVTFIVHSESRARQRKIHAALQTYSFPKVCHIYTSFSA